MVLKQARIDARKYAAHSSRAAATSHAIQQGFTLQEIMMLSGCRTSGSTFERFYHKPTEQAKTFGEMVLDNIVYSIYSI